MFSCRLTGKVVTTDVVELSILYEAPDLGLLQVVEAVVVGSTEVSAKTAVMASDDNTATTGLDLGVDAVLDTQAGSLACIVEDGRVFVVSGTSEVDDAVGGQDVLCASGRVLGGAASNQLGLAVVEELLVKGQMLLLGKDGIVGLQSVFLKQGLITNRLDICRNWSQLRALQQKALCAGSGKV